MEEQTCMTRERASCQEQLCSSRESRVSLQLQFAGSKALQQNNKAQLPKFLSKLVHPFERFEEGYHSMLCKRIEEDQAMCWLIQHRQSLLEPIALEHRVRAERGLLQWRDPSCASACSSKIMEIFSQTSECLCGLQGCRKLASWWCSLEMRWCPLNISFSTMICSARVKVRQDIIAATAGTKSFIGLCAASTPASATILATAKPSSFSFSSLMTCRLDTSN